MMNIFIQQQTAVWIVWRAFLVRYPVSTSQREPIRFTEKQAGSFCFSNLCLKLFYFYFRSKLQRDRERDISEQIALGLPAKTITGGEVQFDQRLMNTSKGMDSGYGDDEAYNVYDKPWRDSSSLGQHLYRPSKNIDKDLYGDDLEKIVKTNR